MKMNNEVVVLETNLSVRFNDKAIADLHDQREKLYNFVKSQLRKDVDYGIIPGVKKECLFKPGAEKLANLFQLGSRIIKTEREVDIEKNFAMISHVVEIFHLPSGKAIAQCEGITNSQEKKWRERKDYKTNRMEATPIGDVLNTLGKMALKRAYVGAVIMAVGASDFFTQDVEDMDKSLLGADKPPVTTKTTVLVKSKPIVEMVPPLATEPEPVLNNDVYHVPFGKKHLGKTLEEIGHEEVSSYMNFLRKESAKSNKPLVGPALAFCEKAEIYLGNTLENGELF